MLKTSTRSRMLQVLLLLSAPSFNPIQAFAQIADNDPDAERQFSTGPPSGILLPSERRVVFESTPFAPGSTIPYWDKGYLISIVPETMSSGIANVILYDSNGKEVRESSIWFPDALAVYILSAAVTREGNILASGTAVKGDGTRASFIAATDSSGKISQVIQTNPFSPANICDGGNGTVWSFGDLGADPNVSQTGNLLRQFDLHNGLLKELLPRSTFGQTTSPPALQATLGHGTYMRCLATKVALYSGASNQYIELDTTTNSLSRFSIARSAADLLVKGFAVTDHGDAYTCLADSSGPEALQGLFRLQLDAKSGHARWVPVSSAAGVIGRLWGADGEYLVHSYRNDPAGRSAIFWSLPKSQQIDSR
jgi:hypothetical protein